MISRPIFVMRFPRGTSYETVHNAEELMKENNKDIFKEYHVLLVVGSNLQIEFEVYNANSIPEEEQKRTKGLILDIISKEKLK